MTHLLYVDDIFVSCRATANSAKPVKDTFESFGAWLGLQMSLEKSCLLLSQGTDHSMRCYIRSLFGVKDMKLGSTYFGNSLLFGKKRSKEFGIIKEWV